MQDFWPGSGFRTLERNEHGWLRVTPDYLRHWLARPELAPISESGPNERALHASLLEDPWREVDVAALAGLEDADARDNYRHFLRLRKALGDAVTLERYLLQLFRRAAAGTPIDVPPLFIDLLIEAVVRGLLDGSEDPYLVRAGELFFRRQRIATENGQCLSADGESVQVFAETGGFGSLGRLLNQQGTPVRGLNLDVLNHETAALFWLSADRYAWLLDLTPGREGLAALSVLLSKWVRHFLGVAVRIESAARIEDEHWRWHLGLDAEASALLNDLYEGREVAADRHERLVSLFRLEFEDAADMRADVAGVPVYLGLAVTPDRQLKLKPQNLLLNLPLKTVS